MQRPQVEIESNQHPDLSASSSALALVVSDKIQRLVQTRGTYSLRDNDVLCGRGSIINKHVGNRRFRRLVSANKDVYAKCSKNSHKIFLALSIIVAIERKDGRFLKKRDEKLETSDWTSITRKEAVAKATQALRDQLQSGQLGSRSSTPSGERLIEAQKRKYLHRDDQAVDEDQNAGYFRGDASSNASSDVTSMDCHQVLPLRYASKPFMGFAELMGASSTMNPCPDLSPSLEIHQQFVLWRNLFRQRYRMANESHHQSATVQLQIPPGGSTLNHPNRPEPSTFPPTQEEGLWVPEELETLMLSDPDAAMALSRL